MKFLVNVKLRSDALLVFNSAGEKRSGNRKVREKIRAKLMGK